MSDRITKRSAEESEAKTTILEGSLDPTDDDFDVGMKLEQGVIVQGSTFDNCLLSNLRSRTRRVCGGFNLESSQAMTLIPGPGTV